jgi:glycosyltransferase involved in cell wall biosynthesis
LAGDWVVVPAYNEATVIGAVVGELRRQTDHVVVVDDCSRDETAAAARNAGAVVLEHVINRGQGAAIQTGLDYALRNGASAIATFDADGQHDAEDLPRLFAPIHEGTAHFALGSRFAGQSNVPPLRRVTLKLAIVFTRLTSGLHVTDAHNGLRAFSRRGAQSINIRLDRMAHASEIMDQIRASGLAYVEVPVRVRYTEYARRKGQRGIHAVRVAFDYLFGRWVR